MRSRPVIIALGVLVLTGCGGERVVAPKPDKVVGSVPAQPTTSTTSTTQGGGGTTTTSGGQKGGGGVSGKALFASNGCNTCHTYAPAGAKSSIGPDLDKLPQYARQAKQPLEQFVRESIVNPDAYVQPGFAKGVMPNSFAVLPKPELDALVTFLTKRS
jgi:cytochrome c551/c552